ncbi:MAG: ABC transporter ATP-binding protein [Elusimicrobia bacterium]|nr:ABC transporter ATP-binding protein [Elusimicrobiota bacterium]
MSEGRLPLDILLKNISKNFNSKKVLTDINLHIYPSSLTGLIGPNGAGKTTLLKIIDMVERPSAGEIFYDGVPLSEMNSGEKLKVRRKMAFISQIPFLFNGSVSDNVSYGLRVRKEKNIAEKIKGVLADFDIGHLAEKNIKYLSGGEKQRVCIARAIVPGPDVLMLDEPTNNLDPLSIKIIEGKMQSLKSEGKTVLLATHNLGQARRLSDYACFIKNGALLHQGRTEEIFSKPLSIDVAEFIGEDNILDGIIDDTSYFVVGNTKIFAVSAERGPATATIKPEDILISNEPVTTTSARNCFKGKITGIDNLGPVRQVYVNVNDDIELAAIITKGSFENMQLSINKEIYLLFKATAVHVLKP